MASKVKVADHSVYNTNLINGPIHIDSTNDHHQSSKGVL